MVFDSSIYHQTWFRSVWLICRWLETNSNSFGTASSDLRKSVADFIKKLSKKTNSENKSLEAFIACRLIPLNKNPGLIAIGVGEVLRRITEKVVMKILKN